MDAANGGDAAAPPAQDQAGEAEDPGEFKLKFCTVCASNQNR